MTDLYQIDQSLAQNYNFGKIQNGGDLDKIWQNDMPLMLRRLKLKLEV